MGGASASAIPLAHPPPGPRIPDFSARSFIFRSGAAPQSDLRPHMKWSQGPEVGIAEVCGGTRLAVMQDEKKGGRVWMWGVHLATSLWFQLPHFLRPVLPPSPPPQPPFHTGMTKATAGSLLLIQEAKCVTGMRSYNPQQPQGVVTSSTR